MIYGVSSCIYDALLKAVLLKLNYIWYMGGQLLVKLASVRIDIQKKCFYVLEAQFVS